MAIVIPSSKTYDRQNPKVRDNVIERIEIGAVEVVPDNEYETPVETKLLDILSTTSETDEMYNPKYSYTGGTSYAVFIPYAKLTSSFFSTTFSLSKIKKNKVVNKVYVGLNKQENPYIYYTLIGDKTTAKTTASVSATSYDNIIIGDILLSNIKTEKDVKFSSEELTNKLEVTASISLVGSSTAIAENEDKSNISKEDVFEEFEDEYVFSLNFLVGNESWTLKNNEGVYTSGFGLSIDEINGEYVKYTPKQIEITIYGNTIGIDLTDKTVYINGKTAKKVHSVDGNELMQTTNYILGENSTKTKALDKMYGDTQNAYAKGKETATIRCSIGDYFSHINAKIVNYIEQENGYVSFVLDVGNEELAKNISDLEIISNGITGAISDYDGQTVSGGFFSNQIVPYLQTGSIEIYIKEISIDNSTGKMSFKENDQVIPMVYGADGKDRPMSLYQDGTPKVFQVLGTKIFYDGAVWQELSLQEV